MMKNCTLMIALWFTFSMVIQGAVLPAQRRWWTPGTLTEGHMPVIARHISTGTPWDLRLSTPSIDASHGDAKAMIQWDDGYRGVMVTSRSQIPVTYIIQDFVTKTFTTGDLNPGDRQQVVFPNMADYNHVRVWAQPWVLP
ncbi:hypothetical protein Pst134EA_002919 [Puccinia striiformis f. sp. tritici]|uniref:hypothetical protein n=1 Tax=Puccinia striiformis f. sp. tritici TaxID=168172 RepID=UPI002007FDE4|nr:hypothetical protein Pst134EA_002919 [Puccinia striiformis f. sp. tritici]KAH9472296.1 hypothetical protein Pst134EA_002919 [Puccinia striiformis f. sp. tritici]